MRHGLVFLDFVNLPGATLRHALKRLAKRGGGGQRGVGNVARDEVGEWIQVILNRGAAQQNQGPDSNSQFKSNKRSVDEVEAEIRAAFESHKCELTDDSQNTRRFVHDSTEDE